MIYLEVSSLLTSQLEDIGCVVISALWSTTTKSEYKASRSLQSCKYCNILSHVAELHSRMIYIGTSGGARSTAALRTFVPTHDTNLFPPARGGQNKLYAK